MMGQALWPALQKAKVRLHDQGISQFDTILLPAASQDELGANDHPLAISHEICAKVVADHIRSFFAAE